MVRHFGGRKLIEIFRAIQHSSINVQYIITFITQLYYYKFNRACFVFAFHFVFISSMVGVLSISSQVEHFLCSVPRRKMQCFFFHF